MKPFFELTVVLYKSLKHSHRLTSQNMTTNAKDSALIASLVLSVASLVLLFGVTWYFQSSLNLLQKQVEYDRELLVKLQEQVEVKVS